MEHVFSKEEIAKLKADAQIAGPYVEAIPFDAEVDMKKFRATVARNILDMYYKDNPEKADK